MEFTILITTFNRLPMLQRAVESALAQTLACELIVVDDCSTDGTAAYLASMAGGGRLRCLRNPHNRGQAASVNAGVHQATGEWVKLLDDDDYLAPNCIAEMAQAIGLHPPAVLCSVQAIKVDANGRRLNQTPKTGPGNAFYVRQPDIHYAMLLEAIPFGTPAQVAFRRDAFLRTGGWDERSRQVSNDADSWAQIAQFGDAVFINQPLAYYTAWSGSYTKELPIAHRFRSNMRVKTMLYELLSSSHRQGVPALAQIERYLRLHWALMALTNRDLWHAATFGATAVWSFKAWQLLAKARRLRRGDFEMVPVHRTVLMD
jgi:glycosyltransferase involved in cell wall biosynthesis